MLTAAVLGAWRSLVSAAHAFARRDGSRAAADRRVLEQQILPSLGRRTDVRRVLFVGCTRYTQHCGRPFPHAEYWTIDPSPRRRRWGGARHVVDRLEELGAHVPPATFDAIVCNGVLGWGLNRRADAEAAFSACHTALRDGGELVLGWNDVWPRNRVRPSTLRALARFERAAIPGLDVPVLRIDAPHRHVFACYRKPDGGSGPVIPAADDRHQPTRAGLARPLVRIGTDQA